MNAIIFLSVAGMVAEGMCATPNKVVLPLSTEAACLDGSPYAFYFNGNASSTRWSISIQGGGWCYNETFCETRAMTDLGSSKKYPDTSYCSCMYYDENGNNEGGCNCAYLRYCDGASFSGYRKDPWPVPPSMRENNITQLMFRGIKNLDATMDFLVSKGLDKATELVVTGGSAGGLSTFLHADRIALRAPKAKVRAAPVVGYFLDHDHFPAPDHTPFNTYPAEMAYITTMQNLTVGALTASCLAANPHAHWKCFMSPHEEAYVKTPIFMFNSKYDAWQMGNILQIGCLCKPTADGDGTCKAPADNCDMKQKEAILQYGKDFMTDFAPFTTDAKNGAYISSCICHGCDWARLSFATNGSTAKRTAFQHYSDWYYGVKHGSEAITVDTRNPNGNGDLGPKTKEPGWENCEFGFYSKSE